MLSLNARLIFAVSIVLAGFFGLTGYTLDRAFRLSTENALKERLQAHVVGLISSAESNPYGQVHFPRALPEGRYNHVGSGLYGQFSSNNGMQVWQSPSMTGLDIMLLDHLGSGERRFARLTTPRGVELYAFGIGVTWDLSEEKREGYTFTVAEDMAGYYAEVASFRRSLWGWLGGVALVLLVVQSLILRWGLSPLRQVAADLRAIEAGEHTQLEGPYPRELRHLTDNLNALLQSQRSHLERYRHTLGDLAHSLKTPLAVLQGAVERPVRNDDLKGTVQDQVSRMTQIVDYQLQRAATSGRTPLTAALPLAELANKVAASLRKVYADKRVECRVEIAPEIHVHADEGDMMELLGNLLDNAFKWCQGRVRVRAEILPSDEVAADLIRIVVSDDGPGVDSTLAENGVQRGKRADPAVPGHGIGLAIVEDIVRAYNAELKFGRSELGGAEIQILLPG